MHISTPAEIYGDLFKAFHEHKILEDEKSIADAIPRFAAKEILDKYVQQESEDGFDLTQFFHDNFSLVISKAKYQSDPSISAAAHVTSLWDKLVRNTKDHSLAGSIIPLPHPYIVPGGRFDEYYYWDSYFIMLGLRVDKRWDLIEDMINNFAWLINKFGFIPNGNRNYYLSRSQPPFFSLMVELLAEEKGEQVYVDYLSALVKEYNFWMEDSSKINKDFAAIKHTVRLEDGFLNRYYDVQDGPREEMLQSDIELAKSTNLATTTLFTGIRATCESGWDFSSRWMSGTSLDSIQTDQLIPVDLNCLLYHLESTISKAYQLDKNYENSTLFLALAEKRKRLIHEYLWNEKEECFTDYNFKIKSKGQIKTAACAFPLFFNLATEQQAKHIATFIERDLLSPGGMRTSTIYSEQQWDAPNGWAPLQWMSVIGLDQYNFKDLAKEIAQRWTKLNEQVYQRDGKFVEKYNVEDINLAAGGGEYELQDGFGWSNGVYLALKEYLV